MCVYIIVRGYRIKGHLYTYIIQPFFYSCVQVNKLVRCLSLLKEYVMDCDEEYNEERCMPPHGKLVIGI